MKKIEIVLDWFPHTNHTGMFVALDKGYFSNEGIDADIKGDVHGILSIEGADIVVTPQASILTTEDKSLVGVATLTQKCDSGFVSLKEAGITRPSELTGKRLTHWDTNWFHKIVGKIVSDDGGNYQEINLIHKNVGNIVETLGAEADATWIYKNWEYFELKYAGKDVNYFALADFGDLYNFCAPAVSARKALISESPESLKAFLGAIDRGYIDAANDPEEGAAIISKYMTNWNKELIFDSQQYISGLYLDETGHWGYIKPERWNTLADWMAEVNLIGERRNQEFTNEFLSR